MDLRVKRDLFECDGDGQRKSTRIRSSSAFATKSLFYGLESYQAELFECDDDGLKENARIKPSIAFAQKLITFYLRTYLSIVMQ